MLNIKWPALCGYIVSTQYLDVHIPHMLFPSRNMSGAYIIIAPQIACKVKGVSPKFR